ncbi:hypothetical protein [Kosakonia cowanii]|uniref:hypothetical protein n=1 Tax=Kosakonia cowanii TaxID=208223 RepID=UPI00289F7E80|nr:hypothetical protein [Kosakonia cowanii]
MDGKKKSGVKMRKKYHFLIGCIISLSGCNGAGVLLNLPTETGYYPPTEARTVDKAPTDNSQKGTRTVIRKAPD